MTESETKLGWYNQIWVDIKKMQRKSKELDTTERLNWTDKENEQLQVLLQSRLLLATQLQVHTHYNGQDLFWEVDYVEQMLVFELDILVEHDVSSASKCDCKVDFGANFSLNAKRKKCLKKKEISSLWLLKNAALKRTVASSAKIFAKSFARLSTIVILNIKYINL